MDVNLYSACLYSVAHITILYLGWSDITPTFSPRDIFNRIQCIDGLKEKQVKYVYVTDKRKKHLLVEFGKREKY
jgi:hypothetical protein